MRVRPNHIRDFVAYLRYGRAHRDFNPRDYPLRKKGNCSTIEAFVLFESKGDTSSHPRHPRILRTVLRGKALLNLQIKEWASGWFDCGGRTWLEDELKPSFPWMPEWVWTAVEQQR